MHQHHGVSSLAAAIMALLILAPAQAQQAPVIRARTESVQGSVGFQRIIDECFPDSASALCAAGTRKTRTVSLQIPDFKPGDQERHVYVMSRVHGTGSGGGTALADDSGLLSNEEIDPDSVPGADPDAEQVQHYFTAYDINTREARVTLDLYQVRILPFLRSLEASIQMAYRVIERQQGPAGRRSGVPFDFQNHSGLSERLSIQGQNLSIDQVLDMVYRETGCVVDQDQDARQLVFAGCP